MRDRFRFFNAMVTPVACFGAAHRIEDKQDLCDMVVFCCAPSVGCLSNTLSASLDVNFS